MAIDINVEEIDHGHTPRKMSRAFGFNLWTGTLTHAPYDTGNLVSSIKLKTNTQYLKRINYDSSKAWYTQLLEEGRGIGEGKKHEGFISKRTMPLLAQMTVAYFRGGHFTKTITGGSRRRVLNTTAKVRGFGKGKVNIGRSRFNNETRAQRRQESLNRYMRKFGR